MVSPLPGVRPSLPANWYYDPGHYRRELEAVWYRDWVCVGRIDSLQREGDYFTARIGDQNMIVTLGSGGRLRAWHNTCRHRGSLLCKDPHGRFRNGRIICPYHTWTYSLAGELIATPGRMETDDFETADYSLYAVHVDTWKGFVFVNLSDTPRERLDDFLGDEMTFLEHWPLDDMHSVHQAVYSVQCNWKLFWENYSECYHCPRLHPELCRIMPVYRKAVFKASDLPGWEPAYDGDNGYGRVSAKAETWTLDGKSGLPPLPGLTEAERQAGVAFTSIQGSMFVVGHPDYARSVRIVPTGPERIELVVDWLLPRNLTSVGADTIERITGLAKRVIHQDSAACELNQRGLRSSRFEHGVLMPQEYMLWDFHQWLRARLGETGPL